MQTEKFLLELGLKLSELATKNTASYVWDRIQMIRDSKDYEKSKGTYEELINKLLQERDDAVKIAQIYRNELGKIEISDEDIKHLHETITNILNALKAIQKIQTGEETNEIVDNQFEMMEQVKNFISIDTLKTMQLIGFNYKIAIGEPLTQVTRDFLLTKLASSKANKDFQNTLTPQFVEVLKNKQSTENFLKVLKEIKE